MLHLQRTDLGLIVWALSTSGRCCISLQKCWNENCIEICFFVFLWAWIVKNLGFVYWVYNGLEQGAADNIDPKILIQHFVESKPKDCLYQSTVDWKCSLSGMCFVAPTRTMWHQRASTLPLYLHQWRLKPLRLSWNRDLHYLDQLMRRYWMCMISMNLSMIQHLTIASSPR